jgi:hypothetical protein
MFYMKDHLRWNLVDNAMRYAAHAESTTGVPQAKLLDNLNATMEIIYARDPHSCHAIRSNRLHWNDRGITDDECGCHDDFMSLAVEANLTLCVQQKLEDNYKLADKPGRPLFAYAVVPRPMDTWEDEFDVSNASMIQLLLDHNADPNAVYEFKCSCAAGRHGDYDSWPSQPSIWQMALALGLGDTFDRAMPKASSWAEMVKTLLSHSASPTVTVWQGVESHEAAYDDLNWKEHSALFVCLYTSMKHLNCDRSLPELVISKGGSLRADELEEFGDTVFNFHCGIIPARYDFLRSFFPYFQLTPPSNSPELEYSRLLGDL